MTCTMYPVFDGNQLTHKVVQVVKLKLLGHVSVHHLLNPVLGCTLLWNATLYTSHKEQKCLDS